MLQLRTPEWGGAWMPVLDRATATAKGVDALWPVSISVKELVYVSTTAAAPYPTVSGLWHGAVVQMLAE